MESCDWGVSRACEVLWRDLGFKGCSEMSEETGKDWIEEGLELRAVGSGV